MTKPKRNRRNRSHVAIPADVLYRAQQHPTQPRKITPALPAAIPRVSGRKRGRMGR